MAADWFRSAAWDEDARSDFEKRLSRATIGNRPQYLRIKGLALSEAGNDAAARELWLRVLHEYPESFDVNASIEHLADSERRAGMIDAAEEHYRDLISRSPTLNGTSGMGELSLAELLIDSDDKARLHEAVELLDRALHRGTMLPAHRFRWHLALTKAATEMGDRETQQRAARTALGLAANARPPFPRHPTVGTVHADPATIDWLESAAAGAPARVSLATRKRRWFKTRW